MNLCEKCGYSGIDSVPETTVLKKLLEPARITERA